MVTFAPHPGPRRLGEYLLDELNSGEWTGFEAAVAFVKASGVRHIESALAEFARRADVRISVGVDLGGTSFEGLQQLLGALGGRGLWVFHNETPSTFHPKVYMFTSGERARLRVGSGNLTQGGLFTNYEASLETDLDLAVPDEIATFDTVARTLEDWRNEAGGTARVLTPDFLTELLEEGYVRPEHLTASVDERPTRDETIGSRGSVRRPLFGAAGLPAVPRRVETPRASGRPRRTAEAGVDLQPTLGLTPTGGATGYLMTLHATDVGYGQTTPGAQRRSAEIFVPLAARDADADFWEWDGAYTPDPGRQDKKDRSVTLRIGSETVDATFYNWPPKHDFRIRTEALRRGAAVGDILRLEKSTGSSFDYYAEIVPSGTTMHATYLALCVNPVRNSAKRWGYY